jgi:hypothetical protein
MFSYTNLFMERVSLLPHMQRCNELIGSIHEAAAPFFTSRERSEMGIDAEYGGITGTIVPSSMNRVLETMAYGVDDVIAEEFLFRDNESIFCDVGCGTGRPSFYVAGLKIKCSLGFDIDDLQLLNCLAGYRKLSKSKVELQCPVLMFKQDLFAVRSLDPVTHVYAFIGYTAVAKEIARLVITSSTLKLITLVVLTKNIMYENGFMCKDEDNSDVVCFTSMRMSGGKSYMGFVIPITERRKNHIIQCIGIPPPMESSVDMHWMVIQALTKSGVIITETHKRPKRRNV